MFNAHAMLQLLLAGTTAMALAGATILGAFGYYLGYSHGTAAVLESAGNGIGIYAKHAAARLSGTSVAEAAGTVSEEESSANNGITVAQANSVSPIAAVCAFLPCATGLE